MRPVTTFLILRAFSNWFQFLLPKKLGRSLHGCMKRINQAIEYKLVCEKLFFSFELVSTFFKFSLNCRFTKNYRDFWAKWLQIVLSALLFITVLLSDQQLFILYEVFILLFCAIPQLSGLFATFLFEWTILWAFNTLVSKPMYPTTGVPLSHKLCRNCTKAALKRFSKVFCNTL